MYSIVLTFQPEDASEKDAKVWDLTPWPRIPEKEYKKMKKTQKADEIRQQQQQQSSYNRGRGGFQSNRGSSLVA